MQRLLDSSNGIDTYFSQEEDSDDVHVTTVQDVSSFLDHLKEKRNQENWNKEVKEEFVHFASIPVVVEMELKKKGINISDKNCTKALMKEIQTNYPYLMSHAGKRFV